LSDSQNPLSTVESLEDQHKHENFDCGKHPSLNEWLKKFAFSSQKSNSTRTYVVHRNNEIVGYYALSAASVDYQEATERATKGEAKRPIPAILLARLAVDKTEQKKGLGPALLKDALSRAVNASNEIGARVVLVHAIDKEAKEFYQHFEFEESPVDDLHLMILIKDVKAALLKNKRPPVSEKQ
jgi:predicted N-acetyltransferase YhbS